MKMYVYTLVRSAFTKSLTKVKRNSWKNSHDKRGILRVYVYEYTYMYTHVHVMLMYVRNYRRIKAFRVEQSEHGAGWLASLCHRKEN